MYGSSPRSFNERGRDFLRDVFVSIPILCIACPLMYRILLKGFQTNRKLQPASKKVVVLHHALDCVILSLSFPVFTYHMIRMNFQVLEDVAEVRSSLVVLVSFGVIFPNMYMFELAARFEDPRPLLTFYHLLTYLNGLGCFFFPTTAMLKTCIILVYFICFEALTFAG